MDNLTKEMQEKLISAAFEGQKNAYSPYSKFKVGAAVLGEDGVIYKGCNIENVSYGLTVCGERVAIFNMVSAGCNKFVALAVVATQAADEGSPCGACRQVMCEFAKDVNTTPIISAGRDGSVLIQSVVDLLPNPFMRF